MDGHVEQALALAAALAVHFLALAAHFKGSLPSQLFSVGQTKQFLFLVEQDPQAAFVFGQAAHFALSLHKALVEQDPQAAFVFGQAAQASLLMQTAFVESHVVHGQELQAVATSTANSRIISFFIFCYPSFVK